MTTATNYYRVAYTMTSGIRTLGPVSNDLDLLRDKAAGISGRWADCAAATIVAFPHGTTVETYRNGSKENTR